MTTINEQSSAFLSIDFFDDGEVAVAPARVLYRIDCVTNKVQVRPWTEVIAAQRVRILINSSDNIVINRANPSEFRKVTIKAIFGAGSGDQMTAEQEYTVKRLQFVG
jgi:hypothetical protein